MTVLIDRNRHTAIVVRTGRKLTHLVTLEPGELVLRAYTQQALRARQFQPIDYPVPRAVRQYLRHAGGVSGKARKALKSLLKQRREQ